MKKSSTKLELKKSTVHLLQDSALAGVQGGAAGALRPTNDAILGNNGTCPPGDEVALNDLGASFWTPQ